MDTIHRLFYKMLWDMLKLVACILYAAAFLVLVAAAVVILTSNGSHKAPTPAPNRMPEGSLNPYYNKPQHSPPPPPKRA